MPPTTKPAILTTLARSLVRNLRTPDPAHHEVPQRNVSSRQAQWFVLSQVDSATVSTPDGRGVTFRRRDPATAKRLGKRSLELNREIRRRFPELSQQYRAAWDDLTSKEAWRATFGE